MKVKDVMNRMVITVAPDTPLRKANQLLHRYNLNSLVVLDDDEIAGILTYSDLFHKLLPSYDEVMGDLAYWTNPQAVEDRITDVVKIPVGDVMSKDIVTVQSDMAAVHAGALMNAKRIKQLPVVDNEKLVGLVSHYDITWGLMMKQCKFF